MDEEFLATTMDIATHPTLGCIKDNVRFLNEFELVYLTRHAKEVGLAAIGSQPASNGLDEAQWGSRKRLLFKVFSHYVAAGWKVLNAEKYGADFGLYNDQTARHSEVLVIAVAAFEDLKWINIASSCRVASRFKKKLRYVRVIKGEVVEWAVEYFRP